MGAMSLPARSAASSRARFPMGGLVGAVSHRPVSSAPQAVTTEKQHVSFKDMVYGNPLSLPRLPIPELKDTVSRYLQVRASERCLSVCSCLPRGIFKYKRQQDDAGSKYRFNPPSSLAVRFGLRKEMLLLHVRNIACTRRRAGAAAVLLQLLTAVLVDLFAACCCRGFEPLIGPACGKARETRKNKGVYVRWLR